MQANKNTSSDSNNRFSFSVNGFLNQHWFKSKDKPPEKNEADISDLSNNLSPSKNIKDATLSVISGSNPREIEDLFESTRNFYRQTPKANLFQHTSPAPDRLLSQLPKTDFKPHLFNSN